MQSSLLEIVKDGKIQLPDSLSIPEGTKVLIVPRYGEDEPEHTTDLIKEYSDR